MPDINGSRKMLDLNTKDVFDIECTDVENTSELLSSIGRFHFYSKVFEKANSILLDALALNPEWLVIDEAGKLELEGKGLFDAIIKTTDAYNNKRNTGNLLITVRDSLCEEIISFFKFKDYRIINELEELA